MAMPDVPKRIWIDRDHGKHPDDWTWTSDEMAREIHSKRRLATDMVQFTRSDLVSDAVKALEEARAELLYWHPDCGPDTPLQDQNPAGPSRVVAKIEAALTRIKGDVT